MNDHDLRQLTRMRQQLYSYHDGSIGLNTLIGDLMFLRDALLEVEKEWENEFTDRIIDLESAYSYALEKNTGKLNSVTQKIVDDAIPKLLSLIEKKQNRVV